MNVERKTRRYQPRELDYFLRLLGRRRRRIGTSIALRGVNPGMENLKTWCASGSATVPASA